MNVLMIASAAPAILASAPTGADNRPAFVEWIDRWQWPLCGLIFLACVIIIVVTARQVRREQEQSKQRNAPSKN
jgi:hypothetical protein